VRTFQLVPHGSRERPVLIGCLIVGGLALVPALLAVVDRAAVLGTEGCF